jgi:hypothetical protein
VYIWAIRLVGLHFFQGILPYPKSTRMEGWANT